MRTFLNLSMVIGAFTSIVFFRGLSNYMLNGIEETFTIGQNGHVQIAKSSIWAGDVLKKKEDSLIENHKDLEKKILGLPSVELASGRSNGYLLLVNGDKSVGAFAIGFDPKVELNIEKFLTFVEGQPFSLDPKFEILVGSGIQKSLQLKIGQTLTVLSQTLKGSMSSVDLEIKGVVKAGLAAIDNSTVYVPLSVVQKLLGTQRVERITILLKKDESLSASMASINGLLKSYPDLQAKPWTETATMFNQLTNFYFIQNLLVEIILSCLVLFGILNTLGMSIFERMGEIGTLRALGDRTSTVMMQLILEGVVLGFIGIVIATPFALIFCMGFSALDLPVLLPGASKTGPVHIEPVALDFAIAGLVILVTCLISSLWPSYRAVRLSIVDSLRANS